MSERERLAAEIDPLTCPGMDDRWPHGGLLPGARLCEIVADRLIALGYGNVTAALDALAAEVAGMTVWTDARSGRTALDRVAVLAAIEKARPWTADDVAELDAALAWEARP